MNNKKQLTFNPVIIYSLIIKPHYESRLNTINLIYYMRGYENMYNKLYVVFKKLGMVEKRPE